MTSETQTTVEVIDRGIWDVEVRGEGTICHINNKGEWFPSASGTSGRSQKTMLKHAALIAEAFNTQAECGLSPRELLEGYRGLQAALAALVRDAYSEPDGDYLKGAPTKNCVAVHRSGIDRARAALAKHKEV